jgi:hypothetical protein
MQQKWSDQNGHAICDELDKDANADSNAPAGLGRAVGVSAEANKR